MKINLKLNENGLLVLYLVQLNPDLLQNLHFFHLADVAVLGLLNDLAFNKKEHAKTLHLNCAKKYYNLYFDLKLQFALFTGLLYLYSINKINKSFEDLIR
ncbi:hypothetical protein BpHYR1_010346 [Brachionus plicatilis]|uniref:Uncharacterized protein n=1 Tax=Brachionus plicatilis TaxID=10195 RepID=A0A3M7R0G1_BRAPC|nr:hypothetical protein BpHYR1_010346 [Brachionus plicatilis]